MTIQKPEDNRKLAVFTVVSNNYLHFARTLLQTVAQHHRDADIFCVIVDRDFDVSSKYSDEFTALTMEELSIPDLKQMIFQYDVLELNTAVKPWAFETILSKGYDAVIYLDPDIFVYRPLIDVMKALEDGSDIVITPHLLSPIKDTKRPTELDIRRAGTYNFGFCAVRRSDNTFAFLQWWQGKLFRDCIVDMDRGIFVDQSWIDLVPGLFDNVFILRNPAYNIAYWNIGQRNVAKTDSGDWRIDGEPLVFFHYSGFNPLAPEPFSKHQNRFTLSTLGAAAALPQAYADALIENGAKIFSKLPYGYSTFSDGTAIPSAFRRLYLHNETLREQMGGNPFAESDFLFRSAEGEGVASAMPITWLMFSFYDQRPDLQSTFDLTEYAGVTDYWRWFISDSSGAIQKEFQDIHRRKWTSEIQDIPHSDRLCYKLFGNLLERKPTEVELKRLGGLCRTKLGASAALVRVAQQEESRRRPKPTRRFKKTLRSIWREGDLFSVPSVPPAAANARQDAGIGLSGLYPPDSDCVENGAWCGRHLSVPLGSGKHEKVRISGIYYPDFLERMNNRAVLQLDLRLDGRAWKRVTLPESGQIDISEDVPLDLSEARTLLIDADGTFVPRAIGVGTDTRELSWRLKEIQVDDREVFNCRSEQKFPAVSKMSRSEGFNLIGYVFAELGVGEAARTMARAAHAANIPYSIWDVGYQTENRQSDRSAEANAVDATFNIDILYVNADQAPNTLRHLMENGRPHADYRIGFWHWEQTRLPEKYWNGFDGLNEVWVPTTFVQDAVSSVSPLPVFKVPHAVDFTVDTRWTRASFGIPEDKFAVLVMYDFHSYRFRKNPEASIAAFKLAARCRDDMALVVKTINASKYPDDYAALKAEVAASKNVVFIEEVYSREQIYALEANCDCMLSLHRAEGFGFGPAEMMFLRKPVIATGWSGNMDFMTSMNSFPVQYELKPLADELGAYAAGLDWAEPDIEHAAYCLRKVVDHPDLARELGKRAGHTMRTQYSPEVIGRKYWDRLATIRKRL